MATNPLRSIDFGMGSVKKGWQSNWPSAMIMPWEAGRVGVLSPDDSRHSTSSVGLVTMSTFSMGMGSMYSLGGMGIIADSHFGAGRMCTDDRMGYFGSFKANHLPLGQNGHFSTMERLRAARSD